jgi:hypothetical protein
MPGVSIPSMWWIRIHHVDRETKETSRTAAAKGSWNTPTWVSQGEFGFCICWRARNLRSTSERTSWGIPRQAWGLQGVFALDRFVQMFRTGARRIPKKTSPPPGKSASRLFDSMESEFSIC